MNKTRTYTQKGHRGISKVLTWIQGRCTICGRFLGLYDHIHCDRCRVSLIKEREKLRPIKCKEYNRNWAMNHREERRKMSRECYARNKVYKAIPTLK